MRPLDVARPIAHYIRRRWKLSRRVQLAWTNHVTGGAQFSMIATKPSR